MTSIHRRCRRLAGRRAASRSLPASATWRSRPGSRSGGQGSRRAHRRRPGAQGAALSAAGQAGDLPVHERRAVARRSVRLQAGAQQAIGRGLARRPRPRRGQAARLAVSSSPSTASRACGSRKSSRTWPSTPTSCASSTACTPTCRTIRRPSCRCTPAASSSSGRRVGAWTLYGLGSENANLPGFITLNPPSDNGGARNYGSGFLPAICQGTKIGGNQIPGFYAALLGKDEEPGPPLKNIENRELPRDLQRAQLDLVQTSIGTSSSATSIIPRSKARSNRSSWRSACRTKCPSCSTCAPSPSRSSSCTASARACRPIVSAGSASWPGAWRKPACGSSRSPPRSAGTTTSCSRTS